MRSGVLRGGVYYAVDPADEDILTCKQVDMARYTYWMVYLPEFCRGTFSLFVNDSLEQTKLRDYSGGKARELREKPSLHDVTRVTELGVTRFNVDPHITTDEYFWSRLTQDYNSRHLPSSCAVIPPVVATRGQGDGRSNVCNLKSGRANRGSQRQLQDYVNEYEAALTSALMEVLPPRLRDLGATIKWMSPLAENDYVEYRDADFLRAVKLDYHADDLADFWPAGGPCWDALAIISTPENKTIPGVILVEAKSHISEIYGNGCQASLHSRPLIDKSLAAAKQWCGVPPDADWTGSLYQSANRLAHLYFVRERLRQPAWLVNLYFLDDPIGPANRDTWTAELQKVKAALGLTSNVPFSIDLFLPGLSVGKLSQPIEPCGQSITLPSLSDAARGSLTVVHPSEDARQDRLATIAPCQDGPSFAIWADRWMATARHSGPSILDVTRRIDQLVRLWKEPIPGRWERGADSQLMGERYRRGNRYTARRGEHVIEYEILHQHFQRITCEGYNLIDGINALPLVCDSGGGRRANVEADMLLLGKRSGNFRLFLCEVKVESNNAWYATVESLRQLKLLLCSRESLGLFARRNPSLELPSEIPVTALVVAPRPFYASRGQKANAVAPAFELLTRFNSEFGIDARLAIWDSPAISDFNAANR